MPFFLLAPRLVGMSLIHLIVHPSDQAYHWAAYSDAMSLNLHGGFLPAFPLNQLPYLMLLDDKWKVII